ncbi:MAG: thiamine diphosphokinase [Thermaerobacter sp.]|nr:thiamine diphosphokinase [Thermaerobacter sp.]
MVGDAVQDAKGAVQAGNAVKRLRSVVILNGDFQVSPGLAAEMENALVIAADGGYRRLARRGIAPHVVVGDFDSAAPPSDVAVVAYPVEKDETDGEIAVRTALSEGARLITIVGAMGGRYDMSFGHVALLRYAAREGAEALLTDGRQAALLVPRHRMAVGPHGRTLSIIPLTPRARLQSAGLRWQLDGVTLRWDEMRGNSNRVVDDAAWIRLVAGQALAVMPYPHRPQ